MANDSISRTVEFPIDTSQIGKGVIAVFLAIAFAGEALNLVLFISGIQAQGAAIGVGIFLLIVLGIGVLNGRPEEGVVILNDDRLEVRTGASRQLYRWIDIRGLQVRRYRDLNPLARTWAMISRTPADYRVVEVRLGRSLRLNVVPGQSGTDIIGIPSLFAKSTRLYVHDPDGFVRAAEPFLQNS